MAAQSTTKATFVASLLFALTACSGEQTLDQATLRALVAESSELLKTELAGRDIPENRWPKTIKALKPLSVRQRAEPDGLYINVSTFFVQESGYFVPRDRAFAPPSDIAEPSLRHLREGVYWYHFAG